MTDYSVDEVRATARAYQSGRVYEMLTDYADLLERIGMGEAVYQLMCTDTNIDAEGKEHPDNGRVWMDVPEKDYKSLCKRSDMRSRILYTTPPAQPAERVVEGCDHEWVDGTNKYVSGIEICTKCMGLRPSTAAQQADL